MGRLSLRLGARRRAGGPELASWSTSSKPTLLRIGRIGTRHPGTGAVGEPEVTLREPLWNQAAKGKTGLFGSCAATLPLRKGNHNKTQPLSVGGRIPSAPAPVKALRPLRGAQRTRGPDDASATGVPSHEEHVCSSVLKRTGVRLRSHRAAWAGPAAAR